MSPKVEILDCTLRDGGYVNNWIFGFDEIKCILNSLFDANIDYIECGFLKECEYDKNKTFFNSIDELKNIIKPSHNYTLLVNREEYNIKNFPVCENKNIKIRVAFKKYNQPETLLYIKELVDLGWDVFANPMSTNTYSPEELAKLIDEINKINPYGLSIVDTLGNMQPSTVQNIFEFIDLKLNPEIAIGFHSHNSMNQSLANTKTLLKMGVSRKIIIDSCLYGMGRGAGNLPTEEILSHISSRYNPGSLTNSIEKIIKPIYAKNHWGYSIPYYFAAKHGCHPNYATCLIEQKIPECNMERIFSQIPENKKTSYDNSFLKNLLQ
jgi:4-hydroxy 2-oxovalerate aldolase